MTQPSYTTDLTLITDAESGGTWGEITGATQGGSPLNADGDFFIQGAGCTTQANANKTGTVISMYFDYGSDLSGSFSAGDVVLFWQTFLGGNAMDTVANGGLRLGIGSGIGDFEMFISGGKDYNRNPYGGWQNIAIDPTYNSGTGDYTIGTPTGAYRYFSSQLNMLVQINKGNLHALDAIRYGRAELKIEYGDATNGYGVFSELAKANDANDVSFTADVTNADATLTNIASGEVEKLYPGAPVSGTGIPASTFVKYIAGTTSVEMTANATATNTGVTVTSQPYNRWGLLQRQGVGYLWKGLMSFGNATNACDFRDSNVSITVDDAPRTYAAFNKIEITNASSRVDWTDVNIISVDSSGLSIGQFEMINDATVNFDTCIFTDMSTFIFDSNATLLNCTWRRCGLVSQYGADIDDCVFDEATGAVALWVDDMDDIDGCTFISDGTGHAIEYRPTGAGPFNVTITGCGFTGYASSDGSTGNECILIHPVTNGATVTLNVVDKINTPTIMEHADYSGTFTLVDSPVTTTLIVKDVDSGNVIENARVLAYAKDGTGDFFFEASVSITSSGTTATATHSGHGCSTNDWVRISGCNEPSYNVCAQVTYISSTQYSYTMSQAASASPATGTPVATKALFNTLTNASGIVTDTRSWSNDQPIIGRARRYVTNEYYKTSPIDDVISNADGLTLTVYLIPE